MKHSWIHSAALDSTLILSPPFLAVACVWILRGQLDATTNIPLWAWVTFVLCIDVAHVYSTLFRTYFSTSEFQENKTLLWIIPLLSWSVGVLIYSIDSGMFWSVLAYVAVFHFIRQQYGFMMLYSRHEPVETRRYKWIDKVLIYLATLYPIVYWHTHLPRNFSWFVEGDFVSFVPSALEWIIACAYVLAWIIYIAKECFYFIQGHKIAIPKQAVIFGTALSWCVGIVALNGDMPFTIINVVSHGVPYMALTWIFTLKEQKKEPSKAVVSKILWLPAFLGILLLFAYVEEGLWAGFVWREHLEIFGWFASLPHVVDDAVLACLVPLLSLPQVTHYVLDGFIWKLRDPNVAWQKTVFDGESQPA